MNTLSFRTVSANKKTVSKKWVVVDADAEILGRLSSKIAMIIRGKHKPDYTPHVDCGDHVIVVNAEKVRLTGNKWNDKQYVSYTGYPGGQRFITPKKLMDKHPRRMLEKAVRGMLPKNRLGDALIRNLYVYAGPEHPHAAQNPESINL